MSLPNDDPWQGLLSDLGVDATAAPLSPPAVSSTPAPPRRVPVPPKSVAAPPAADWSSLAENLGITVTNAGTSPAKPKAEPTSHPTVSVGGVEIVRAVRGPDDLEPPLAGGGTPRSAEDRERESGDDESRAQRPASERGDRGEQRGRNDRSRGGRDRSERDSGRQDRGDRPRSNQGRSDQPHGEQGRSAQGRGRDDRGPSSGRPSESVTNEPRSDREAEPRSAEPRTVAPRSDEPRRSDSRRGGRDQGRSRGPRDAERDSRRPQGQRDEPRPPVSDPPRPAESRRYRDDEDDDLDDLRAPIRSAERPGEPPLDSTQAARKLWDDEEPPVSSGYDVFGIIDEKIGGPPIIERHPEPLDDELTDAEPRSAEEGELESSEDRPRRRRRRRGGRSGRRPEGTARSPRTAPREGDEPLAAELGDEPLALADADGDKDEDAPRGRRRRRRRTSSSRDSKSTRPAKAVGDDPASDDVDDLDLEPIRSREGQPHEDDDAEDQHHKHLHRDVTPWKDAIGFLVSANMENRSRSPRSSDNRGYRGGRDRG